MKPHVPIRWLNNCQFMPSLFSPKPFTQILIRSQAEQSHSILSESVLQYSHCM